ncbi:hypothetical protein Tco_0480911 [Tanacetum coccineum]
MLAPKGLVYNGRPTFANPMYLKKAESEKPCLYEIPYDTSDLANRFTPDREETLTLEQESRSKLNKDLVKPYDYTNQNSLYEVFNHQHKKNLISYAWKRHIHDQWHPQPNQDLNVLLKNLLVPLALKTQNDSFKFVHELTQEMFAYLQYVQSLKKDIDELEFDKVDFSNIYDLLLQECVLKDVMCSYLHSLSDLDAYTELQCMYQHKSKECECLAEKLSKQTETISKEVYIELLRSFAKLEKLSISIELALQQCQEQIKNNTVCKENESTVFLKERAQYFEIQDLKAQLQDKNISISELKKLIEKMKGKSVDTNFEKQSILGKPPLQPIRNQPVVRQLTAYKFERSHVAKHWSASQVDMSINLTKPVTPHSWPQVRKLSFAKPYDVNAPGPSRKSPKHVSFQSLKEFVGSNDMKKDAQSHKTTKRYTSVEKKSDGRQIPIGQRFSPNNFSNVYLKTTPPRSGLTWKPMGRIFTQVGLKWIPIRKSVETCYNTNDSASPLEKKTHSPNTTICANSSSLSAGVNKSPTHPCDFARTFRVILFSIHSDEWKSFQCHHQTALRSSKPNKEAFSGILLASFQDDAKYEHVGQDTRSQDGKDVNVIQRKDLRSRS